MWVNGGAKSPPFETSSPFIINFKPGCGSLHEVEQRRISVVFQALYFFIFLQLVHLCSSSEQIQCRIGSGTSHGASTRAIQPHPYPTIWCRENQAKRDLFSFLPVDILAKKGNMHLPGSRYRRPLNRTGMFQGKKGLSTLRGGNCFSPFLVWGCVAYFKSWFIALVNWRSVDASRARLGAKIINMTGRRPFLFPYQFAVCI